MKDEAKVRAGQASTKHGIYAIRDRGVAAMTPVQVQAMLALEDELKTSEGVVDAIRRQTATGLIMLRSLEYYVAEETQAGTPLEEIKIFQRWPSFSNSVSRLLALLLGVTPAEEGPQALAAELERIDEVLGEHDTTE